MGVNRYFREAKLPDAQPFFELPFNEIAGAMSARQQRYDTMQESLAKAQAEANSIIGIPGTVQEAKAKEIQNKLTKLGTDYIDKDLAGVDGSQLLGEIRKTALDPAIPYITESYKNWNKANEARAELKKQSKYNEYLAEDFNLSKLGLNDIYNFSPTAYEPEDIGGTYFSSIKPDSYENPLTGEVTEYVDFDTKILPQAQKMAQHYITTPKGAAELVVARSSWDESELSISFPGKTIGELDDADLGAEILARGGSEYLYDKNGYQTSAEGKRTGGVHTAPKDLSIASIEATVGYNGVSAAWAHSNSANKYLRAEVSKNMQKLLEADGYKESITGLNNKGEIIPNTDPRIFTDPKLVSDNFDFVIFEESNGDLGYVMTKKPNSTIPLEQENEIREQYNNKATHFNINHSLQYAQLKNESKQAADYDAQLRKNAGVGDYTEEEALKTNPSIRNSRIESFVDAVNNDFNAKLFADLGGGTVSQIATLSILTEGYKDYNPATKMEPQSLFSGRVSLDSYNSLPPDEYEKYTEYMYSPDGAEATLRKLGEDLKWSDKQINDKVTLLKSYTIPKGEEYFQADLEKKDPKFAKLNKEYVTGRSIQTATGYTYTFGSTDEAKNYKKVIEETLSEQIASSSLAVFDRLTNKEILKDSHWGGYADATGHFIQGKISVTGWRPDPDPDGGIAIDFTFRDEDGNKIDEKTYEARGVDGIAQYLRNNEQYQYLEYKSNYQALHKGFDRNGGWRTSFTMGPEELSIDVEKAMADDRDGAYKKGWYRYNDNGVWKAVPNEARLFEEYKRIAYAKGTSNLENTTFESITAQYNRTPNFDAPVPLPDSEINRLSNISYNKYSDGRPAKIHPLMTPQLTKAMILQESFGDPNIVNKITKATGLMQVLPTTSRNPGFSGKVDSGIDPYDPESNVRFGKQYMSELLTKYNGDTRFALMAYNWGFDNVDNWIRNGENMKDPKAQEALRYYENVKNKL